MIWNDKFIVVIVKSFEGIIGIFLLEKDNFFIIYIGRKGFILYWCW